LYRTLIIYIFLDLSNQNIVLSWKTSYKKEDYINLFKEHDTRTRIPFVRILSLFINAGGSIMHLIYNVFDNIF